LQKVTCDVSASSSFSPSVNALLEVKVTRYEQLSHVLISINLFPNSPRGVEPEGSGGTIAGMVAELVILIFHDASC
jgi:hypothetical protein